MEATREQQLLARIKELENKPLSIEGDVIFITPSEDVSKTAKPFFTRNVCLDSSAMINGTRYENSASMQFIGDNCKLLDDVNPGDRIEVNFSIKGKVYTKDTIKPTEKNKEAKGCITNLAGYSIKIISRGSVAATAASAPVVANGVKPDVIPDGYEWNEEKKALVAKDDLPF